jgi:hypothetical protein
MNELVGRTRCGVSKTSFRKLGEAAAVLGVVGSLVFVGLELRNNGRAARAAAYQELGLAAADTWLMKATDRELNDLVEIADADDPAGWDGLDESDRRLVTSYVQGLVRQYETVFLQVNEKLLPADAMESLGWHGFGETNLVIRTWPRVRKYVTPGFAAYLEAASPQLRNP